MLQLKILNDYVDGTVPTNAAESALHELLKDTGDELLVKDFKFLVRTYSPWLFTDIAGNIRCFLGCCAAGNNLAF